MKPMLPTLTFEIPKGDDWIYEPKYDGFRALLHIGENSIQIISRNGHDLSKSFPEIIQFVIQNKQKFESFLPCIFDGELVHLVNKYQANFEIIQQRGRLKSPDKIELHSHQYPCQYVVFDIIKWKGKTLVHEPLQKRKHHLKTIFTKVSFPLHVYPNQHDLIQFVEMSTSFDLLWSQITKSQGEGIVAKKLSSTWNTGKRTKEWLKYKNYKSGHFIILGYNTTNGYFHVGVHQHKKIIPMGSFSHGLDDEKRNILIEIIRQNGRKHGNFIEIDPAICVKLNYLSITFGQLREVFFDSFLLDYSWEDCTLFHLKWNDQNIHHEVHITHPDKILFPKVNVYKQDYLSYLLEIFNFMLPFLKDRALTVVRYPHGMLGEAFYQKNCPEYAPTFIQTKNIDHIDYILCQDLSTFMWLGNQLAIEFHIPYNTVNENNPVEIVFDLDPPSKDLFSLAIKAAIELKHYFDTFSIQCFPKLSGNKGIQIHIPITGKTLTYEDTRTFTSFFANYLCEKFPDLFTTERMKKNRGNRLYVDYIQHAEGKTIICPYSVRGNENGSVAAPLYWEELNENLKSESFTIDFVVERLKNQGCPMTHYFTNTQDAKVKQVIEQLSILKR